MEKHNLEHGTKKPTVDRQTEDATDKASDSWS